MSTTGVFAGNDPWGAGMVPPAAGADARGRTPVSRICVVDCAGVWTAAPALRKWTATRVMRTSAVTLRGWGRRRVHRRPGRRTALEDRRGNRLHRRCEGPGPSDRLEWRLRRYEGLGLGCRRDEARGDVGDAVD